MYCASSSQSVHTKKSSKIREDYPKPWIILVSTKYSKRIGSNSRPTHQYSDDEKPQPESEFQASYRARITGREGLSGIGKRNHKKCFLFLVSWFFSRVLGTVSLCLYEVSRSIRMKCKFVSRICKLYIPSIARRGRVSVSLGVIDS